MVAHALACAVSPPRRHRFSFAARQRHECHQHGARVRGPQPLTPAVLRASRIRRPEGRKGGPPLEESEPPNLRSRFAKSGKFRPTRLRPRFSGIHGIRGSKMGTDHSVPNPQSRKRPQCIFGGQSGLSPFLKGRTNLVRVNPAGRRWNRRMPIPARMPRESDRGAQKFPLLRLAPQTARIRSRPDAEEKFRGRHGRNPSRPTLRSRFAKAASSGRPASVPISVHPRHSWRFKNGD